MTRFLSGRPESDILQVLSLATKCCETKIGLEWLLFSLGYASDSRARTESRISGHAMVANQVSLSHNTAKPPGSREVQALKFVRCRTEDRENDWNDTVIFGCLCTVLWNASFTSCKLTISLLVIAW